MNMNPFDFSGCRSHAEIDAKRNAGLLALAVFAIIFFTLINL